MWRIEEKLLEKSWKIEENLWWFQKIVFSSKHEGKLLNRTVSVKNWKIHEIFEIFWNWVNFFQENFDDVQKL